MKQEDDSGIQKQYNHYKNPFEIVKDEEHFKSFKNHKLKKVRFDVDFKKKYLECFLYLFDVKPDKYAYLNIVKGEAQSDRQEALISDLFKPDILVFAGYLDDETLKEYYIQKLQGIDY